MKPKLLELSEILKQKPEIKERLERLEFGCWVEADLCNFEDEIGGAYVTQLSMKGNDYGIFYHNRVDGYEDLYEINFYGLDDMGYGYGIIGREPQYSDVLEYLEDLYLDSDSLSGIFILESSKVTFSISISPGPLSEQSDKTLDEIISLCKNNVPRN